MDVVALSAQKTLLTYDCSTGCIVLVMQYILCWGKIDSEASWDAIAVQLLTTTHMLEARVGERLTYFVGVTSQIQTIQVEWYM